MKMFVLIVFLLIVAGMPLAVANANLITNGSFELGDFNNTDADPRLELMLVTPSMPNILGWSVIGALGVHWQDYGTANTTDGSYSVDLQGRNPPGELSSISTMFESQVGRNYTLTFDALTGGQINSASVSAGSLSDQIFTGGSLPYYGFSPWKSFFTNYTYGFTATASSTTLTFQVVSSDGWGPIIDNVAVTAVPEPSTMLLLGSGLFGLVAFRKKASQRYA